MKINEFADENYNHSLLYCVLYICHLFEILLIIYLKLFFKLLKIYVRIVLTVIQFFYCICKSSEMVKKFPFCIDLFLFFISILNYNHIYNQIYIYLLKLGA